MWYLAGIVSSRSRDAVLLQPRSSFGYSWTYGLNWPNQGEVDLYENWNNNVFNQPAMHTGDKATCTLDGKQTATVIESNCNGGDDFNEGCVSSQNGPPFASADGGFCESYPSHLHMLQV